MRINKINIQDNPAKEISLPEASFLEYAPNFKKIKKFWNEYGHFKNLLIIGHGGSVSTFKGIYNALKLQVSHPKEVYFLSTVDPDYIHALKEKLNTHDTLVIAISKSGETVTQIEAVMQFIKYPLLAITKSGTTLEQIAKKVNAKIIAHPEIGGRFSGLTEVGLIPAAICGFNIEEIYQGAKSYHEKYRSQNLALEASNIFANLENKETTEVFVPIYSAGLFGFSDLLIQLCHESFSKDGKGLTFYTHEAPESQHHTNQRFFGGRRNVAGLFLHAEHFLHPEITEVPTSMHSLPLRNGNLFELNKIPLAFAMNAEFQGTWENAKIKNIPAVALAINIINAYGIGELIGFMQLFAVYSAALRGVNPFDQPAVEDSKNISWNKRQDYKRL